MDGSVSSINLYFLQPVRIYYRTMGNEFRETTTDTAAGDNTPGIPGRQFLFGEYVAAVLANCNPVQPGALSNQRFPLELLRSL